MDDRFPAPGKRAHVNPNRTVIGANPTLYTARGIRHHLSRRENHMFFSILFEDSQIWHISIVVQSGKKLRVVKITIRNWGFDESHEKGNQLSYPLPPPCLQRSTFVKYTRRAPQIRMNAQLHNSTGADLGEAGWRKKTEPLHNSSVCSQNLGRQRQASRLSLTKRAPRWRPGGLLDLPQRKTPLSVRLPTCGSRQTE